MAIPTSLIVCPTSHMDWDWQVPFNSYYKNNPQASAGQSYVQNILDTAFSLMQSETTFIYNLAELGWLQRYLIDQNGEVPKVPNLPQSFCMMGGAITSPDNIVCDGEVFVRTYLVGRQWAQSVGLTGIVANVSWMPDDFGHDPELPVILAAMGLPAVGFARVPGAFPTYITPLNNTSSLACQLMTQGVAFNWQASDSSKVFAHFMPDEYGVPFYDQGAQGNATIWQDFINSQYLAGGYQCTALSEVVWPGNVAFAPAGGDFAEPSENWVGGVNTFNDETTGPTASVGTFADYVKAVQQSGAQLTTMQIDPSTFWTGYFGSRPALKILQAQASSDLVSAETVSSLLRLGSPASSSALDALDAAITQVWNILAPSSHHDFVTGTSPDCVYKMEQYPMLSLAAKMAEGIYEQALLTVADMIPSSDNEHIVVVHNPVGVERGGIFKLDRGIAVSFPNTGDATVQTLLDGGLLVQSPSVQSLGYVSGAVTFDKPPFTDRPTPHAPEVFSDSDEVTIDNGTLAITLSADQCWAITSIVPSGGSNLLANTQAANLLQIYNDSGNLYQYGNEPGANLYDSSTAPGIFSVWSNTLTAGQAVQTEFGPLRWHVDAEVGGPQGIKYVLGYTLIAGESIVRMSVTGSAPSAGENNKTPGTTVVTTFPAIATDGTTQGTHLVYGTAHHFHEDTAPAYWLGPVFKATHDFLMPAAATPGATFALAAIYHNGMPAWSCYEGMLLGSLFRNTDGTQRGAHGTDADTHTQHYALRISMTPLDPTQGTPLIEALQVTRPLRAVLATTANQPESPITMPANASLASAPSPALVRVTRPMGEVVSAAGQAPQGEVALRLYLPDADGTVTPVAVTMPILANSEGATAILVTALEDPIASATTIDVSQGQFSVPTMFAVTTVAVTATRPPIPNSCMD